MCKRHVFVGFVGGLLLAFGVSSALGDILLSNGALAVTIRSNNGAINKVTFGGSDYYNPGSPVSNFGLQNSTNASTFRMNTTSGGIGQTVAVSSGSGTAKVTGTFTGGGANVFFQRIYSLVSGTNVLRTTTTFTNNGSPMTMSYFDTFDPDQGVNQGNGTGTFNDVFNLVTGAGTAKVGQAMETGGLSVVMGSLDPNVTVASGNPFAIGSGSALNSFFSSPFDGNGAFADRGTHVGLRKFLGGGGQQMTFTFDQAYGLTATLAQDAFKNANQPIPAPGAALLAMMGMGMVGWVKRRRA